MQLPISEQLPTKLTDLYAKNYLPILTKLTTDLKNWNRPVFSWFGRATILKMNALPRMLYILQTVPIHIPLAFFKSYRSLSSNFIWGGHKARIKYTHLTLPKYLGGIGLPDLQNYYKAVHLTRILDWNLHTSSKDWVGLEDSFSKLHLASVPWILDRHIPPEL